MASPLFFISFLIAFSYPSSVLCDLSSNGKLDTYIINVRRDSDILEVGDLKSWHRSFLPPTAFHDDEPDRLVYSYSEVFSGFTARLTVSELAELSKKEGFVRVYPNRIIPLLTTHTPDFLGITGPRGLGNSTNLGKGVIVGVLDTGILPEHPSFYDDGVPPPPKRWKGKCEFNKTGCNNKIIGARGLIKAVGGGSPVDDNGHGTHTASTIAGNFVKDVDPFGVGRGTAAGMAPHAHLAIYKVCNSKGCSDADILAGLDAAVKDGVDIVSLSLGGTSIPYDQDVVAIGAFTAIEKGITVVCAAGNGGPAARTLTNEAPWILTVAASSVDRSFRSTIKLGDGSVYNGEALFQPANFSGKWFPLVYAEGDCLDGLFVNYTGKILVCDGSLDITAEDQALAVQAVGGVGIIAINERKDGYTVDAQSLALPGAQVAYADGEKIKGYIKTAKSPYASFVFNGTVLGLSPAPVITSFSSRGPNQQSPGILKPDVTAPGLSILAGWHESTTPNSKIPFQVISGTSMATPHVSGIAALIKSLHPEWSPAAIKSTIITSSYHLDRDGNRIKDEQHNSTSFFVSGAGHVNPVRAAYPGLVYDLEVADYIAHLCTTVGDAGVAIIAKGSNITCKDVKPITDSELNYPTIIINASSSGYVTVNRTVTNVGFAPANYTVKVDVPKGVKVTVKPDVLQFWNVKEKQTFCVTVQSRKAAEGNLEWVSGETAVRSALIITKGSHRQD